MNGAPPNLGGHGHGHGIELQNTGPRDSTPTPHEDEEDNTELRRTLRERHVGMLALSYNVGIGFFLQTGKVIYYTGPGVAIFVYLIAGSVVWSAVASLGEMTALFPVRGAVFEFVVRFLDEGLGFAVGWMAWYLSIMVLAAEVTAVSQLFNFRFEPKYLSDVGYPESRLEWPFGQNTNPAVWAAILVILFVLANLLPIRVLGEIEYIIGCCKMTFLVTLILLNVIINAHSFDGKAKPPHFKYYNEPYSFQSANFTVHGKVFTGGPAHLASVWTSITTVIFGMGGFNMVALAAAESRDIEKDESIKLATRKISLRVITLYTLAAFTVGLNVPYTDPNLRVYAINSLQNGQHSIFIIAAVRAHLLVWPHFINGFFIFSATSTGIIALYMASRILHALAVAPDAWPRWGPVVTLRLRLERTTYGVPMVAVLVSALFGLLGFLTVKPYPAQILGRIVTNAVASALIVYCVTCAAFLRFYKCIKEATSKPSLDPNYLPSALDRDNDTSYPYRSHGQYVRAWYGFFGCFLLVFFNGWRSVVSPMNRTDFVASYINIPIFVVIFIAYHIKAQGFDPRNWKRMASEDLRNPLSVAEKNPRMRRGRLRRVRRDVLFCRENATRLVQWVWEWLK